VPVPGVKEESWPRTWREMREKKLNLELRANRLRTLFDGRQIVILTCHLYSSFLSFLSSQLHIPVFLTLFARRSIRIITYTSRILPTMCVTPRSHSHRFIRSPSSLIASLSSINILFFSHPDRRTAISNLVIQLAIQTERWAIACQEELSRCLMRTSVGIEKPRSR